MGYRGEVMAKMKSTTDVVPAIYKPGERFAQIVIVPIAMYTITEATELSESDRGENGYGSSDTTTNVEENEEVNNETEQAA